MAKAILLWVLRQAKAAMVRFMFTSHPKFFLWWFILIVAGIGIGLGIGCARVVKEFKTIPEPLLLYSKTVSTEAPFVLSVSSAGDFNGDGKADFMVGAPSADTVYVYSGSDGNLLGQKSGVKGGRFGSLIVSGDIQGDGKNDFIISAASSVDVYSGEDFSLLYQKSGAVGDDFGSSLASGDVNGDGKADLIVGAPYSSAGRIGTGAIYVYKGTDGTLLWQKDGFATYDRFGTSITVIGDINSDGKNDIAVGAPYAASGGSTEVGVIYLCSGTDGTLLRQISGEAAGDHFGFFVSSGDINGDGKVDFMVGAPLADPGGKNLAGSIYIYSGRDFSLLLRKDGMGPDDQFGSRFTLVGDLNGDGKSEFVVGAPTVLSGAGLIYVFSGADGSLLYQKNGSGTEGLGTSLASAGDVNGDGKSDFLVGSVGSVYVFTGQ